MAERAPNPADSIMSYVVREAEKHESHIKSYDSNAYIKGITRVLKRNILLKYAPEILPFDKKGKETIIEALVDMHYDSPKYYTQKITALTGTRLKPEDISRIMHFQNINVYNSTAINNEYVMPFTAGALKYYQYDYERSLDTLGLHLHCISIKPKKESPKLLTARAHIVDGLWSVAYLEASGKYDFADFRVKIEMGLFEKDILLPVKTELFIQVKLLGNHIENQYTSMYSYSSILKYEDEEDLPKTSYDVSEYYEVEADRQSVVRDSSFWSWHRPIALLPEDMDIYTKNKQHVDTTEIRYDENSWKEKSNRVSRMLFQPRSFQYKGTHFRYSGFLNPFKVGYSPNSGLSYSQQLNLKRQFRDSDREVSFNPNGGYASRRKEFFVKLPVDWLYLPQKMGTLSFAVGNGNRGLDSRTISQINDHLRDSTFKFEDFHLEYYKDYYSEIRNRMEIFNGFIADLSVSYHYRKPVVSQRPLYTAQNGTQLDIPESALIEIIDDEYRTFEPSVTLIWNPGQYYRMIGKRKMYVDSYRPTFSLQYTRGMRGVMNSDGKFEKVELDIQQRIPLRFLSSVQYYAGMGMFTNSSELYFVDFSRFTRRNFPNSWDDKIGGVFQILDDYWYYSSKSYVQAHAMYESPFILLGHIKKASRFVFSERIYFSQLYLPGILPSYTEVGYGIGNFVVNVGVFASFEKMQFQRAGFKFAFELFN